MALPSTSVWEVRSVGNDTNGGGFDSTGTGTDFSQQDSKNSGGNNSSTTDAVAAGTTTITSATASFTSAITGNIVYFSGGTGTITGTWRRATFVSSTSITIDSSIAASTGMTMNIGGALATPQQANTNAQPGNTVYVKATASYAFTSTMNLNKDSRALTPYKWVGYTTTRTDNGRATFTTATNSTPIISPSGTSVNVEINNISFTTTASVKDDCIKCNSTGFMWAFKNCVIDGFTRGFDTNSNNCQPLLMAQCEIKNCTIVGIDNGASTYLYDCYIHANAVGVQNSSGAGSGGNNCYVMVNCIVASNTSQGANITAGSVNGSFCEPVFMSCAFYSNTSDGIKVTVAGNTGGLSMKNCVLYGNGGWGVNFTVASAFTMSYLDYNAVGSNSSGNYNNITAGTHDVALTADPFTSSTDFSLNATTGGGAALKNAGYPGVMVGGGTGYEDIGPLQHQDTPSSTTIVIGRNVTNFLGEQGDF